MKIESAIFRTSALNLEACPTSRLPEFAFVGRSNVGKSSLINMLTGKKQLAKTSATAGKTRLINFFEINHAWNLVDLPGYGYAKVSKDQRDAFNEHVSGYLTRRENLKTIFVLVDSRLEPLGGDLAFVEWLEYCNLPYSIVFTKTDRTSDTTVKNHAKQFLQELATIGIEPGNVYSCSAKTNAGRSQVLNHIQKQLPKKSKQKDKGPTIQLGWMKKR